MTQDTDPKAVEALALAGLEADEQRTELLDVAINTGTYDKRTHVAVPREMNVAMLDILSDAMSPVEIDPWAIWESMLRAAEEEE